MKKLVFSILALSLASGAQAADKRKEPLAKTPQNIRVAALPDRGLIGRRVNVYVRPTSAYYFQTENLKPILKDVLLVDSPEENDWGASTRRVTLELDAKEAKVIRKAEERGRGEIVILAGESTGDLSSAKY
jgi:hypothetical protein